MPPKTAGGRGKKKKIKIDGADLSAMTRDELESYALAVNEEINREKSHKQVLHAECFKIRTYWDITLSHLYQQRCMARNSDREVEISSSKNASDIKNTRQRIKYLQHVRQDALTSRRVNAMLNLKQLQDDHIYQENILLEDIKELTRQFREQDMVLNEEMRAKKLYASEHVYNACKVYETFTTEVERTHQEKTERLREEFAEKHTHEIFLTELRKNTEIQKLMDEHADKFHRIKCYYNEISLNNLALINKLQEQLLDERSRRERLTKEHGNLLAANRRLSEPIKQLQEKVTELNMKMKNYNKDMLELVEVKKIYQKYQKKILDLEYANMAQEYQHEKLLAERDALDRKYREAILEVQRKKGTKNVLLQQQVDLLNEQNELRDVILCELFATVKAKPTKANEKLDTLLNNKNNIIKDIQYELARVGKLHDDLLQTYEGKLASYNINPLELGHQIIKVIDEKQKR